MATRPPDEPSPLERPAHSLSGVMLLVIGASYAAVLMLLIVAALAAPGGEAQCVGQGGVLERGVGDA